MEFYKRMPDENIFIDIIGKWIVDILLVIVIGIFIAVYICSEYKIVGNSMSGMLNSGEKVFVNTTVYNIRKPSRYDVVKFSAVSEDGINEDYVKRIIGLPGETVQIKDGYIYINDKKLSHSLVNDKIVNAGLAGEKIKLEEDEYFVLGDNCNSSEDSRFKSVGNVKLSDIQGKVWMRISPFVRIGFV